MKKIARQVFSMRFAMILLLVLAALCVAGSLIPQGNVDSWYEMQYGDKAHWILALGLNDLYHRPWFVALGAFLCLELLGCDLIRFPNLMKQTKQGFDGKKRIAAWQGEAAAETGHPKELFYALGFRNVQETKSGLYAAKNKLGIWGAWLCHLGMVLVIAGFGLGQMTQQVNTVYGVKGQTKPIGDTGYMLTIDDFSVDLRPDDTVDQYRSALTVKNESTGFQQSGEVSVNWPMNAAGMKLYQNSTGWAARLTVEKGGETLQSEIVCAGEMLMVKDMPGVTVAFAAFYPDYVPGEDGAPGTASGRIKNPAYLYRLYYGDRVLGMNVLTGDEKINIDDYSLTFSEPQSYTLIQIKQDRFTWLAALGGGVVILGLLLAFYLRTAEVWAVKSEEGTWKIGCFSRKGGVLLQDQIREQTEKERKK